MKERIRAFLIQDKLRSTMLILAVFVFLAGVSSFFFCKFECINPLAETIYYCTQIVSAVFIVAGVVFAGFQYYISESNNHKKFQAEQIQKAIDLAEYYKDNVLAKYSLIKLVYKQTGIINVLQKANYNSFKEFDMAEAKELYSEDDLKNFKKIYNSEEFVDAIILANSVFMFNNSIQTKEDGEINRSKKIRLWNLFMQDYVSDTLNNMEFFAMHFTHKTADESVIYQSLSQSYLEIVKTLYYNIVKSNETAVSKYYTNVIELYTIWKERADEAQREIRRGKQQQLRKGNVC